MIGIKKIVIIFFSLQVGFSNSILFEVFTIPYLIEHYKEHSDSNAVDFVEFIKLHYSETEHQKEHNSKHDSLPFYHIINTSIVIYIVPKSIMIDFFMRIKYVIIYIVNNDTFLKNHLVFPLWHPPRFI